MAVIWGINANNYCSWCKYINCIPTEKWSCNERAPACEVSRPLFKYLHATLVQYTVSCETCYTALFKTLSKVLTR